MQEMPKHVHIFHYSVDYLMPVDDGGCSSFLLHFLFCVSGVFHPLRVLRSARITCLFHFLQFHIRRLFIQTKKKTCRQNNFIRKTKNWRSSCTKELTLFVCSVHSTALTMQLKSEKKEKHPSLRVVRYSEINVAVINRDPAELAHCWPVIDPINT